jgi:hypothetical protein
VLDDIPAILDMIGAAGSWLRQEPGRRVDGKSGAPRLLQGQGFEHLRTLEFPDPWDYPSAALFQKSTAVIDTEAAARFEILEERRRPARRS